MLQVQYIREHFEAVVEALSKRNIPEISKLLADVVSLDEKRKKTRMELDNCLAESNKISKEIGLLFQKGEHQKADALKDKTLEIKQLSKTLSEDLERYVSELDALLYKLPNTPHKSVAKGFSAEDNEEVFRHGELSELPDTALMHWDLAKKFDLIDFDLGAKITGSGFPVYKGKGAKLQRALVAFFLDRNTAAGYTEYQPPFLVNEVSGIGTGQLPDKDGQMYYIGQDNLYLIPTAEVPVTNFFRDVILDEKDLPICCTAYTPCFRREAGSYGSHVRGLNRLHQFDKVEIVRVEHPQNSYQALEQMVEHVKTLLNALQLPYRILRLCGGDMGFTSALTYDFEVFSAAQKRWLEVSSVSNFETFQSNRLKLRYKDQLGKTQLAHTLNGSSLALPRVLAAILEQYQTESHISIPEVLRPYTGFDKI